MTDRQELEIERLKTAREALSRSARYAIKICGLTRRQWEDDPEIVEYAAKHGVSAEDLSHISALVE